MKFSTSVVSAIGLILPAVQAHSYLSMPDPMGADHENGPLDPSGSNYPCKMIAPGESVKTYTPGVQDYYQITGSAVHGGGSCQISVTYDETPTKDSVFKVVQSYEGSCPIDTAGNLPANPDNVLPKIPLNFPQGLKSGKAVFAWTWFNKVGNREMYMNCARITIGGSSTTDDVFNSLPEMFVANIDIPQSQCTTAEGVDIQFPNPGSNVIVSSSHGANLGPACQNYKTPPKMSSAAPPTYSVTSRPAFVGNPDQAMPTATTMMTRTSAMAAPMMPPKSSAMAAPMPAKPTMAAPMPSKMPNTDDSSYDNMNGNNGNSMSGGNNNTGGRNQWGAKPCTNKKTMICNEGGLTFNWCDENGSLWENQSCPLRTKCIPGTDINEVPPVNDGKKYRRHLAAHKRRSQHLH